MLFMFFLNIQRTQWRFFLFFFQTKERLKREIIRCVAESKLINYSDQLILEHFLPEGKHILGHDSRNETSSSKWPQSLACIAAAG